MKARHWYVLVVLVLSPLVWWLAGFDFNHRGPDVAFLFVQNLLLLLGAHCFGRSAE